MKYEIDKQEKYYLLKPKVEKIDSTLSPTLKADFITFEVEGAKNMIVNLENVKYIDSKTNNVNVNTIIYDKPFMPRKITVTW